MKHYCITGGIGAGKSYVCNVMKQLYGISIYDCDRGAKVLMNSSPEIITSLTNLIGTEAYKDGRLNKAVVAQFLLESEANKQAINAIVHPAVIKDFHASGMQWMESAILYEAHLENCVDAVLAVTAPRDIRISRIMERDNISRQKAEQWIDQQMPQESIAAKADYVIINDGTRSVPEQLSGIDIIKKATKNDCTTIHIE